MWAALLFTIIVSTVYAEPTKENERKYLEELHQDIRANVVPPARLMFDIVSFFIYSATVAISELLISWGIFLN